MVTLNLIEERYTNIKELLELKGIDYMDDIYNIYQTFNPICIQFNEETFIIITVTDTYAYKLSLCEKNKTNTIDFNQYPYLAICDTADMVIEYIMKNIKIPILKIEEDDEPEEDDDIKYTSSEGFDILIDNLQDNNIRIVKTIHDDTNENIHKPWDEIRFPWMQKSLKYEYFYYSNDYLYYVSVNPDTETTIKYSAIYKSTIDSICSSITTAYKSYLNSSEEIKAILDVCNKYKIDTKTAIEITRQLREFHQYKLDNAINDITAL